MLGRLRELGLVVMQPRSLAQVALRLNRGEMKGLADVLTRRLSERDIRRLSCSLFAKEPMQLTCERDGLTWTVDTGDEIGRSVYIDGRYGGEEIDAVIAWLGEGHRSTVVDVGANVGTTTIPFAKAGYNVVAIEPVPTTFAMLSRNVEDNGFGSQVCCVNRAISATSGRVDMWVTKGSGLSELAVSAQEPGFSQFGAQMKQRITVDSGPLGDLLRSEGVETDDIALVWSDTQGSESYVVETGAHLWTSGVPLYLEVFPTLLGIHGELDVLIEQVEKVFGEFFTRDALIARGSPLDIKNFRTFVTGMTGSSYSDALLIPQSRDG
jgi:FkbM family methyltransferase